MKRLSALFLSLGVCSVMFGCLPDGTPVNDENTNQHTEKMETNTICLSVGERTFTATLVNNSSTQSLLELLEKGDLVIEMEDYARMEKVGSIGANLPRNDKSFTAVPGDLILYQGHYLVIYYDRNTYTFTPLGKINDVTAEELKTVLGNGDVTVCLWSPSRSR